MDASLEGIIEVNLENNAEMKKRSSGNASNSSSPS